MPARDEWSHQTGRQDELWLAVYVVAISAALTVLRSLWAWATLRLILFRAAGSRPKIQTLEWRLIAVTSLAGVRGAVTLSGVMTLPLTLQDGSLFPTRDLAILLAAGAIIVSLIAANVGLPYLMKGVKLPLETLRQREEDEARLAAAQAAVSAVERTLRETGTERQDADLYMQAGGRIMAQYRQRIEGLLETNKDVFLAQRADEIERGLRLVALRAERDELYRIARSGKLTEETTRTLVRELDPAGVTVQHPLAQRHSDIPASNPKPTGARSFNLRSQSTG